MKWISYQQNFSFVYRGCLHISRTIIQNEISPSTFKLIFLSKCRLYTSCRLKDMFLPSPRGNNVIPGFINFLISMILKFLSAKKKQLIHVYLLSGCKNNCSLIMVTLYVYEILNFHITGDLKYLNLYI